MATVVIVGDVGGCSAELARALGSVPADAGVGQVGDLVDRGPDSSGVLALVGRRLAEAPRRWVQLLGNHEAPYVGHPEFWPERLGDDDAALLRGWWLTERM